MADSFASNMDWMRGWNDVQQKTWETWSNMMQKNLTNPFGRPMETNPWGSPMQTPSWGSPDTTMRFWRDGVEQWWKMFSPAAPVSPEQAVFRNMMSMGEQYLRMGEEVFKAFQHMKSDTPNAMENWTDVLNQAIQQAKKAFSVDASGQAAKGLLAMFGLPMEMWRGVVASSSLSLGDMPNFMSANFSGNTQDMFRSNLERMMSAPAVGLNREMQEKMQAGVPLMLEFQEAQQAYLKLMSKVGEQSLDLLHKRLLELGANDKPLGSMNQLYDLWVDCSEIAYAEVVTGEEYQQVNARLTNALFKVKQHSQQMIDDSMRRMNLPTRADLDAGFRTIQELKRRIRALEDELRGLRKQKDMSAEIKDLRDDIEHLGVGELRSEVERLRRDLRDRGATAPAPATPAPVARTTTRRAVVEQLSKDDTPGALEEDLTKKVRKKTK